MLTAKSHSFAPTPAIAVGRVAVIGDLQRDVLRLQRGRREDERLDEEGRAGDADHVIRERGGHGEGEEQGTEKRQAHGGSDSETHAREIANCELRNSEWAKHQKEMLPRGRVRRRGGGSSGVSHQRHQTGRSFAFG